MAREAPTRPRLPDTYLLIAAVGLLVFLAGFIFSPGRFELQTVTLADGNVTQRVDPETFRYVEEAERGTLFASGDEGRGLFNSVYEGLVSGSRTGGAVAIIAFILLTGGAFGVIMATGTIDRALGRLIGERTRDPRLMLAALKQREVDERIELDDAQVTSVLDKMAKQRRDSLEQYEKAGRHDLAEQETFELELLKAYLPAQLGEAEVDALIDEAVGIEEADRAASAAAN